MNTPEIKKLLESVALNEIKGRLHPETFERVENIIRMFDEVRDEMRKAVKQTTKISPGALEDLIKQIDLESITTDLEITMNDFDDFDHEWR